MKVFISYTHQDQELANFLADHLSRAGFDVWRAEEQILPGENAALKIGKALEESDAMIVLVTPEAVQSARVREEINYALGSPKYAGRVIPVVVRPTDKMPWVLDTLRTLRAGKNRTQLSRRIIDQLQHARAG